MSIGYDEAMLASLTAAELEKYEAATPLSRERHAAAQAVMVDGVPLHWMDFYPLTYAFYLEHADGIRLRDADGNEYLDFGLCGTAAMWGHLGSTVAAVTAARAGGGITTGWPSDDAVTVSATLAERFGVPLWHYTLSATEANRTALRIARVHTGRSKIVAFSGSYHGSIDDMAVLMVDGRTVQHPNLAPSGVDASHTTVLVPFNDIAAVRAALADGDVAAVITEPALTNGGGIAFPQPGFMDELRQATRDAGTVLIIDETQSVVAGIGGATREWGLKPDMVVIGKSFALGLPIGGVGMSAELGKSFHDFTHPRPGQTSQGGLGSTLTGSGLTFAMAAHCLAEVSTVESYKLAADAAQYLVESLRQVFAKYGLDWSVMRLGGMVSYAFHASEPVDGSDLRDGDDKALRDYLYVSLANRGILIGSLGGTIVVAPQTTRADVDRMAAAYDEALEAFGSRAAS